MSQQSKLTITTGVDRGKVFELSEELIHIGRGSENQVVLNDDALAEHQASIVKRNGRFAIYSPVESSIELDGSTIPAEQWVWLPDGVKISLGGRTSCLFSSNDTPVETDQPVSSSAPVREEQPATTEPTVNQDDKVKRLSGTEPKRPVASETDTSQQSSKRKSENTKKSAKRSKKSPANVAKFITNKSGVALVQLGADGKMPQLQLEEGVDRKKTERKNKAWNPLVLYGVLSLSFVLSLAMLFGFDFNAENDIPAGVKKTQARDEITSFYGKDADTLDRYQSILRAAQVAHSRNDRATEMRRYRQVLGLLSSEDVDRYTGLSGKPSDDTRLRELIRVILSP